MVSARYFTKKTIKKMGVEKKKKSSVYGKKKMGKEKENKMQKDESQAVKELHQNKSTQSRSHRHAPNHHLRACDINSKKGDQLKKTRPPKNKTDTKKRRKEKKELLINEITGGYFRGMLTETKRRLGERKRKGFFGGASRQSNPNKVQRSWGRTGGEVTQRRKVSLFVQVQKKTKGALQNISEKFEKKKKKTMRVGKRKKERRGHESPNSPTPPRKPEGVSCRKKRS